MRAARLLSLLLLLQSQRRSSASALAQSLGVSTRTVLRDIDHLSSAGVPIWVERGREGGFQLREGWSTSLTGLTTDEAHALTLAGIPSAATELGFGAAGTSARMKLLSALPDALREGAMRVSARLHVDPHDWYRAAEPVAHLQTIASAVWQQRRINARYESWTGIRQSQLSPLGLVLKAGAWYCVAIVAKQTRTYRLASFLAVEMEPVHFKYPAHFQLSAYWQESTARFERERFTSTATLVVSERGFRRLLELNSSVAQSAQHSRVAVAQPAGWTRVSIPIESTEHAAHQLISLGIEMQVVEPRDLRVAISELAQAIAGQHATLIPQTPRPVQAHAQRRQRTRRSPRNAKV